MNSDGTPSDIYRKFRNNQTSGAAVAEAIRIGYRELFDANEYCYDLSEKDLHSLICQVTGAAADSSTARLTAAAFKNLKSYADFDAPVKGTELLSEEGQFSEKAHPVRQAASSTMAGGTMGLNLSYTINLNLPATSDQAVFRAFPGLNESLGLCKSGGV